MLIMPLDVKIIYCHYDVYEASWHLIQTLPKNQVQNKICYASMHAISITVKEVHVLIFFPQFYVLNWLSVYVNEL